MIRRFLIEPFSCSYPSSGDIFLVILYQLVPAMFEISSLMNSFPYLGIFVLLALGDLGFPFPEDTTLILSGFLIAQDVTKPVPALLVVYCTLLATDFSLYWVGKKYGKRVIEDRRFRRIISAERLAKVEGKFRKWGVFVVLVGRHILGVRAQVFLVAGVLRMPALKFLIADAASAILTVALMAGIGYFGGNSIQILRKDVTRIEHIAILISAVLLTGGIIYYKYLRSKKN